MASIILWAMTLWCMIDPETSKEYLKGLQSDVTATFTWLYIGSNGVWVFYAFALYYYFGHVKLGKDNEEPAYDDASYFMMLFCAGVAVGLIFYGASEPLFHYIEGAGNRYTGSAMNDNEKATSAMNLTLYHWGIHGWVVYSTTAICIGILAYRYDLPLTYRTCFFPLLGKATWGWAGDIIDSLTIAGTVAGVCTSL